MWISWDSHGGCQLGPSFATTSSSTAHYKSTAWTPATPGWTEPAKQFQNAPAEGKGFFSLQERVDKATDMCCWPEAVRCSIRLCGELGTHHGDHLAPSPRLPGLSCPGGSRKVKCTSKLWQSRWYQRNGGWTQNSVVKILTYFQCREKNYLKNSLIFFK